jgi:hypothetical protein
MQAAYPFGNTNTEGELDLGNQGRVPRESCIRPTPISAAHLADDPRATMAGCCEADTLSASLSNLSRSRQTEINIIALLARG